MTHDRLPLGGHYENQRLIAGLWQLSSGHSARADRTEGKVATLERLFHAGWQTFDCADIYTGVEELLGRLRRRLAPQERQTLAVHTKFVPDRSLLENLERRHVRATVERSLARTASERLDLVQFHWWDFATPGYTEAAGWLQELRDEGKIRCVGVTNFDASHLRELLDAGIEIASNQVQYSLLDRRPAARLTALCQEHGVGLLCYGALAGGLLGSRYLGQPEPGSHWENRSLEKYALIVGESGGWERLQLLLQTLSQIAQLHGVDASQVAMRWVLDRPSVSSIIVGTRSDTRADQRESLLRLALGDDDRRAIATALEQLVPLPGSVYELERAPGSHSALMKTDLGGHASLAPTD